MSQEPSVPHSRHAQLEALFHPRGIAIAGASADATKPGHHVLNNLLEAGYGDHLAAINPKADQILGIPSYPDLGAVPAPVEMLILAVPARTTPGIVTAIRERVRTHRDLKVVVAIAGGFAETGTAEGIGWQQELAAACREAGVRLVGPNCVGIIDNRHKVDTTFLTGVDRHYGGVSLLSQSGAMGAWMALEWGALPAPVGLNKFVSLGNMADVDMAEILAYLGEETTTRSVGLYVEGLPEARSLLETAGEVSRKKPVVVLKVGRTGHGSDAAKSHTGALAGADAIYDGAFRQYDLIRATRVDDFTLMLHAFDRLPLPAGGRVAVLTNAGGPGVYALDALSDAGADLGKFSPETRSALGEILPPFASIGHPDGHVDMTGGVVPRQVAETVAAVMKDPGIDAVFHLFIPTQFTPAEEVARELLDLLPELKSGGLAKPLFPVFLAGHGVEAARKLLEESGLPTFGSPDQAARILSAMVGYAARCATPAPGTVPDATPPAPFDRTRATAALRQVTDRCLADGRRQLTEVETYEVLTAWGFPVAPYRVAATPEEAAEAARTLGRVVVKILSPDILHKTDAGCVRLGLSTPEAVAAAAAEVLANARRYKADARIDGLLIQQMAPSGVEIIAGGLKEDSFGPVVMAGLGGIFTEVMKDVAFRLAPVTPAQAEEALRSLKGFPLLTGVRGRPPVDLTALSRAVANLSELLAAWPELKELDLNPLIAYEDGVVAVDGLATLKG